MGARPKDMKVVKDGQIPVAEHYTTGNIAFLFGVAHLTAQRWIDDGTIPGFRLPGSSPHKRERRVLHRTLMKFVSDNPELEHILDKLSGDLDKYERTPSQKAQEILNATARSARPAAAAAARAKPKNRRGKDADYDFS